MHYTYYDSSAGLQSEIFDKLSTIIKHIEDFGWNGESMGTTFQDGVPIVGYVSTGPLIKWQSECE